MKRAAIVADAPAGLVFREDKLHAHEGKVLAGVRRRKWRADERVDAAIREAYRLLIEQNDRQALKRAAREIGWPKYAVRARALSLGLSRIKEPEWSIEEIAILRADAHFGLQAMQRRLAAAGFPRPISGILQKRRRLELTADGGYTAGGLGTLMGIDSKVVTGWIERGWLAATPRGTSRTEKQGGDHHWIRREDVKAFVFARPEAIDLRKVEKWWFLDLVTDGEISR